MEEYLDQVVRYHVSGRLKVAPEHVSDRVLEVMRKPSFRYFHLFKQLFDRLNARAGKRQQIVPYFISSHPGSSVEDMAALAVETQAMDFRLEQVQDFTPTPMTISTDIYYSGYHPYTLRPVFTAKKPEEKKDQNVFFFWYRPGKPGTHCPAVGPGFLRCGKNCWVSRRGRSVPPAAFLFQKFSWHAAEGRHSFLLCF